MTSKRTPPSRIGIPKNRISTDEEINSEVRMSKEEIDKLSKEDLVKSWLLQDQYIDALESKSTDSSEHSELVSLRESEEKLKQQQLEATRRENILVMRLTTKEQEMQEYASQIQELKQAQIPSVAQLRSALLDPAVNLMFEKLRKEMDTIKARLEETQNELSAWKFTPDSNTGKRLMAKCRLLYQENEELGKMISSGKLAKLEGDLALQRSFSEEMKKSQSELDEFLLELDEDVEGMQSTIYYLQQQLREAKEQVQKLQQDKKELSCLISNSPANQQVVVTDDNTDTEGEPMVVVEESVVQQTKENKLFHPQPLVALNDVTRTEGMSNQTSDRGTNSGRPWSPPPPPVFDLRTEKNRTNDQKVPVDEVGDVKQAELTDDCHSPSEPLHSDVMNVKEIAPCEDINSSTLADTPSVSMTHVNLNTENDAVQSVSQPEKTADTLDIAAEVSTCAERKKTEKKQTARKNAVDSTKRTAENGRGRKRTRPRTPVDQSTTENSKETPNPKRTKQKANTDCSKLGSNQRTSIEIDTDTEVQVAQTLALWATAKQDRTDNNSVNTQEPSDSVGNGELKENKTEAEV